MNPFNRRRHVIIGDGRTVTITTYRQDGGFRFRLTTDDGHELHRGRVTYRRRSTALLMGEVTAADWCPAFVPA